MNGQILIIDDEPAIRRLVRGAIERAGMTVTEAANAFDAFDATNSGRISIEYFAELLDEIGEGFHGEELDCQLKLVDREGSKTITRESFLHWYCNLLQNYNYHLIIQASTH